MREGDEAVSAKICIRHRTGGRKDGNVYYFHCPGCDDLHGPDATWTWNGSIESPTLTPSVLVTYKDPDGAGDVTRCHSYIANGRIQFLSDCTHKLAGQTVDMVDFDTSPSARYLGKP